MITDWIGRREALLPINQNYDKIQETNKPSIERWTCGLNVVMNDGKHRSLLNEVHRNSARKMTRTFHLQVWRVHCPVNSW